MKVMVCHPGHSFSTSDVYDGLCAGLRANAVEVVPFEWGQMLRILGAVIAGQAGQDNCTPEQADKRREFATWLASADSVSLAIDAEVDAVIVVNGLLFPPSRTGPLRKLGIPVACYGTEAPYFDDAERQIAPFYSHWFTNERRSVERFSDLTQAFYLPHAWNPEKHQPGPRSPTHAADVVFVGGGYPERKALLDGADWDGIRLAVHGTLWHLDLAHEHGATDSARAQRYSEGSIPNEETCQWHRSSTIALNLARRMTYVETGTAIDAGAAESLGPRAYEIPAVRGFMLCDDDRMEVFDVYGEAAATFKAWDACDLERQIRYWLSRPDERERVAKAQYEAVQAHSWTIRAQQVLEVLL